jgi:hypothetical protein
LRNPSQIEIGREIEVPCLDAAGEPIPLASTPAGAVAAATADAGAAGMATVEPAAPAPLLVTVADPAALSARLGLAALRLELGADGFALRPEGQVGGAAPTVLRVGVAAPDCDATPAACADALWSSAILEELAVVHARRASPQADGFDDLRGLRVCRADSLPEPLLAGRGVATARAASAESCLRDVAVAQADVAVTPAAEADAALADPALAAALAEQVALTFLYDVKATGPADDPATAEGIAALDAGLARLRRTGAWFAAVDAALAAKTAP